jgi:hypothetical protein
MSPGEKLAAWITGLFVAITRWFAVARAPWDSDEGLFMSALRHYDVVAHHPHPPGFPLYIAAAKLFTLMGLPDFRALQLLSIIASAAIVPAVLFLGRQLRFPPRVSIIAAAFLAFFPNVWFFGGAAFSDVPSMTLSIIVVALLLRGASVGGGVLLGIAAAFRPQTLLIAAVPALIGVRRRLVAFVLIVVVIIAASYGAAAHFSGGWERYRNSLAEHQQYIATHDSFRAPLRPPMWELFDNFFLRPYDAPLINIIVSALAAVSLVMTIVRRRAPMLILLASYGPFCITAWALLDRFSTSRFSIGYAPLIAFLAADGLDLLLDSWPHVESLAAAAIVSVMIVWTWPALGVVHRTPSPPSAAAAWIANRQTTAYVADEMRPIFDALLANVPHIDLPPGPPPLTSAMREGDVYVREGISSAAGTVVFRRPRGRLASIARSTRYFEVSIVPIGEPMRFADGWYEEERTGTHAWRWMGRRGRILLPPHLARMRLALDLYVPLDALPKPPNITIMFNGVVLDRIHANIEKSYDVAARTDAPNELIIETDETVNPAARGLQPDTRDLGLRLNDLAWSSR